MDENIGQIFIPIIEKPHFESFSGIPVKKIRDNVITEIDVKGLEGRKLEACGGVILAHCLESNSSVTVVAASRNLLRADGAKAFADVLKVNKTLTDIDLSDNEIGAYAEDNDGRGPWIPSPEGPAALADGLKDNSSVTKVRVLS